MPVAPGEPDQPRPRLAPVNLSPSCQGSTPPAGCAACLARDPLRATVEKPWGTSGQRFLYQDSTGAHSFRLPDESVYVYWSTAALEPSDEGNPTTPFSTRDYDATALLRCRGAGDADFGNCPAGILRMEGGQASIVVQNRLGERFTINFMQDYVNATNREVKARLEGDSWILRFANGEVWEVPLAAIEGG